MADQNTLRKNYKAGYNLHPEIGNILLEVDTDAKTVTPILEPDSPYTVTGGGGLNYVIPEQTVTFNSSGKANVSGINVAGLASEDTVITKFIINNNARYEIASYYDNTIEFSDENIGTINTNTGVWTSSTPNRSMNVSAIRGF